MSMYIRCLIYLAIYEVCIRLCISLGWDWVASLLIEIIMMITHLPERSLSGFSPLLSFFLLLSNKKVKLATIVKGDLKAPFSIATTPRCRGGRYSFPGLLYFTLDPYLIILSVKKGGIKYHFLSLLYDSTCDWTQGPGPLANTLTARSMSGYTLQFSMVCAINFMTSPDIFYVYRQSIFKLCVTISCVILKSILPIARFFRLIFSPWGCVDLCIEALLFLLLLRGILSVSRLFCSLLANRKFVPLVFSTSSVGTLWVCGCSGRFLFCFFWVGIRVVFSFSYTGVCLFFFFFFGCIYSFR